MSDDLDVGAPQGAAAVTAAIKYALKQRLEEKEWVLCHEVMGDGMRRADVIAVNLWPSRGHEVQGFEVKATRSDWLRELKDPEKGDYFHARTHRWSVVAPAGVVLKNELPKGWGLLEWNGKTIVSKISPELREPAIDHAWMACLIRRVREGQDKPGQDDMRAAYRRGHDDAQRDADERAKDVVRGQMRELAAIREQVAAFEKATGSTLSLWMRDWPAAAKWVMRNGDPEKALREAAERLEVAAKRIRDEIGAES